MVILVLRPAFERMVVTFVSVEPGGQEEVGGVFHRFGWCAEYLPIARSGILARGTRGGENFPGKFVVGPIGLDLIANPGAERFCSFGAEELAIALKQVSPFICP